MALTEAAGLLKATLLALGTGAALKGVQLIVAGFKSVSQHVLNMGEATNILRCVGDVSALSGEQIKRLGTLTKGLSDSQLKLILSSQNLSTAQMQAILQASGLTSAEAAQKIQTLGLATAQQTTAGATWSLTAALNGLKVAIMSNPIGTIATAVSIATVGFSLLSSAMEAANQKAEENRNSMNEAAEAANNERKSLDELIARYRELANAGDWDFSARESARQIQEDITDLVGEQADNLDLVNGKLDDQIAKLDEIRLANAEEAKGNLDTKYRDTKEQYEFGIRARGTGTNSGGAIRGEELIDRILKEMSDAGIAEINDAWRNNINNEITFGIALDGKSADEVLSAYKELQNLLLNSDEWHSFVPDSSGTAQDVLNMVSEQIGIYEGIIDEYQSAQKNFFENAATIDLYETLQAKNIDSQEAFDSYYF